MNYQLWTTYIEFISNPKLTVCFEIYTGLLKMTQVTVSQHPGYVVEPS